MAKDNHYTDELVGNTDWQRRQVELTQEQEKERQQQPSQKKDGQ